MRHVKNKVIDFLKKYRMDHEDIDIEKNCSIFIEEMEKGLAGKESSLEMLPTYIQTDKEVPINEPVVVIDAGGTNFRVATICFNKDKKPVIFKEDGQPLGEKEQLKRYPMPGSEGEVSKQEFFQTMAGYLERVVDASPNIGFCFSYPTEVFSNKDGKVIRFSKEIKAPEVIGEMVGEELFKAIKMLGFKGDKHVVVLNDTVTVLLAGISSFPDRIFDSHVGFILGTGANCCYIERNENIKKIAKKGDLDTSKSQIINVESGGFGMGPRGFIDLQFDESTVDQGEQTFEKMISGAYLGPLCLKTAQIATESNLLSMHVGDELRKIKEVSTEALDNFMRYPKGDKNPFGHVLKGADDTDLITMYYLFDRLIERAAKLAAINLSSVVIKSGAGTNPCFPVCIVVEGTTFYKLKSLKEKVEYYLKRYLEGQIERYYEIVNIENATLVGAAIAGLTN